MVNRQDIHYSSLVIARLSNISVKRVHLKYWCKKGLCELAVSEYEKGKPHLVSKVAKAPLDQYGSSLFRGQQYIVSMYRVSCMLTLIMLVNFLKIDFCVICFQKPLDLLNFDEE